MTQLSRVFSGMLVAALLSLAPATHSRVLAQGTADVSPERTAARAWYRDAKFGMFVHWGVYSQLAQGEWVMQNRGITVDSYEWLASAFNPVKFNAHEWVSLAKAAGVQYITITSRHHDGFSMFATKATRYNIVDWTPFARDPMKELAEECQKQGIKLFFYYSQLDWHNTDYWPRGRTGLATGRPERRRVEQVPRVHGCAARGVADALRSHRRHLVRRHVGQAGCGLAARAHVRSDTPAAAERALIVPNHHKAPLPGEDVQTFEQDLPGANTAGFNTKEIGSLPLESSLTMNGSWGFNITDKKFKSTRELIGFLVRAAGNDANLLLNIGPRPDGTIQPEAAERLRALGDWLRVYGSSIYRTRGGPVPPREWGVTTRRGDTVFVHVLDWPDRLLALPDLGVRVVRASAAQERRASRGGASRERRHSFITGGDGRRAGPCDRARDEEAPVKRCHPAPASIAGDSRSIATLG